MTTVSVPLPSHLEELVKKLAKQRGSNKAEVVRHALELLADPHDHRVATHSDAGGAPCARSRQRRCFGLGRELSSHSK